MHLVDVLKDKLDEIKWIEDIYEIIDVTKVTNSELLIVYKYYGKIYKDKKEIRVKVEKQATVIVEASNIRKVIKRSKNENLQSFLNKVLSEIEDLITDVRFKMREKEEKIAYDVVSNNLEELELFTDYVEVSMEWENLYKEPEVYATTYLKPNSIDEYIVFLGRIKIYDEFDMDYGYSESTFYIYGVDISCQDEELQELVFSDELMRKIAEFIAELKSSTADVN